MPGIVARIHQKPGIPDLSNVGREMTVDQIREALLGRSRFDLELQDLEGRFHLLQQSQFSSIQDEKQSTISPVKASLEGVAGSDRLPQPAGIIHISLVAGQPCRSCVSIDLFRNL
jgi:hypothetical protein